MACHSDNPGPCILCLLGFIFGTLRMHLSNAWETARIPISSGDLTRSVYEL
jgi:hypothetical protein